MKQQPMVTQAHDMNSKRHAAIERTKHSFISKVECAAFLELTCRYASFNQGFFKTRYRYFSLFLFFFLSFLANTKIFLLYVGFKILGLDRSGHYAVLHIFCFYSSFCLLKGGQWRYGNDLSQIITSYIKRRREGKISVRENRNMYISIRKWKDSIFIFFTSLYSYILTHIYKLLPVNGEI